jgi:hypothetical protein
VLVNRSRHSSVSRCHTPGVQRGSLGRRSLGCVGLVRAGAALCHKTSTLTRSA